MATPIDETKYKVIVPANIMGYCSFQTGSLGFKQSWVWDLWVYSLFCVTKQLTNIIYDRNNRFTQIRHAGNAHNNKIFWVL
jgi:hypothetical protein